MAVMQAESPRFFRAQLFGGRWDGREYDHLEVLPGRIIVPDTEPHERDLYYMRANWSPTDYHMHGYMRYDLGTEE